MTTPFTQEEIATITAFNERFGFSAPTLEDPDLLCFDDLSVEKTMITRMEPTIGGDEERKVTLFVFHTPVYYPGHMHEPPSVDMRVHSRREYLPDILVDIVCFRSADEVHNWYEGYHYVQPQEEE